MYVIWHIHTLFLSELYTLIAHAQTVDTRPIFSNFWNGSWNEAVVKPTEALTTWEVPEERISSVVARDIAVTFGCYAAL